MEKIFKSFGNGKRKLIQKESICRRSWGVFENLFITQLMQYTLCTHLHPIQNCFAFPTNKSFEIKFENAMEKKAYARNMTQKVGAQP